MYLNKIIYEFLLPNKLENLEIRLQGDCTKIGQPGYWHWFLDAGKRSRFGLNPTKIEHCR
jgi:hypothetical protein